MLGEVQTALGISTDRASLSQTVNEAAAMRRALESHREETDALREERAELRASLEEEQAQNLLAPVCRACRRAPALRTQLLPGAQPPFPPPLRFCANAPLCIPLLGRTDAPVICLPPFTYPSSPFALLTASPLPRADSPPGDDEEQLPTSPTAALAPEVALVAASKRIEGLEKEVASLRQRLAQSKAKGSRRTKDEDTTGKIRDFGYILSRFDVHFESL